MTITGLTNKVFHRAILMGAKRLYLILLLLLAGCQQAGTGIDKPALPADKAIAESGLDKQLKINRDALLKGTSEQIRIDAAAVMLFSKDPLARQILLDALSQSENTPARIAVCRALSHARAANETIENKQDFIQPLFDILTTEEDTATAQLAAEATLIFPYEQIQTQLEQTVTDSSLPTAARLNAIEALKLQPDKRAVFKLMDLLDDPQKQLADASADALESLGIPVGKDARARREIRDGLQRRGKEEFLMYWRIRQEMHRQISHLEDELDKWQRMYLTVLNILYDGLTDDADRGKFLTEHLTSSEAIVRLWALDKVYRQRVGAGTKSKLPAELGPILVSLVSDPNRDVRLKTAKLLSLMGELNSAQKLLEQLKSEQDDEVKTELLVALGRACYYAFLPNSGINIDESIRKQTLEVAAEYLSRQEPKKAHNGAEVIRKLLEQNGLPSADVDKYLGLLAERYNQQKGSPDGALRGELLSAMAALCAQSVYKDKAATLFEPLFKEALNDATDLVREAAVDGLAYIDETSALRILRKDFTNDTSARIKAKLIELSGKVGGRDDLLWLSEEIGISTGGEPAWQAMLKIFNRSESALLSQWIARFDSPASRSKLSDEQMLSLLEIAENKAAGENNTEMLEGLRERLAGLYKKTGDFEQSAKYLGILLEGTQQGGQRDKILAELLDVYLSSGNLESAGSLIANRLLEKKLRSDDPVLARIDKYLETCKPAMAGNLLGELAKIELPQPVQSFWRQRLVAWQQKFSPVPQAPVEPNQIDE